MAFAAAKGRLLMQGAKAFVEVAANARKQEREAALMVVDCSNRGHVVRLINDYLVSSLLAQCCRLCAVLLLLSRSSD